MTVVPCLRLAGRLYGRVLDTPAPLPDRYCADSDSKGSRDASSIFIYANDFHMFCSQCVELPWPPREAPVCLFYLNSAQNKTDFTITLLAIQVYGFDHLHLNLSTTLLCCIYTKIFTWKCAIALTRNHLN